MEHKIILKNAGKYSFGSHCLSLYGQKIQWEAKLFGYQYSSQCLLLCSAEENNAYKFGTTLARVNDNRIFLFG